MEFTRKEIQGIINELLEIPGKYCLPLVLKLSEKVRQDDALKAKAEEAKKNEDDELPKE